MRPRLAAWSGLPFLRRAFLGVALLTPIGVCLGAFIASGLDELKAGPFVPWAWGINGIFSVPGERWLVDDPGIDAILLYGPPPSACGRGGVCPGALDPPSNPATAH